MIEGRTYFDAVLDENMQPVFNGTPEQTQEWLKCNAWAIKLSVCIGRTMQMVSAKDYVRL
jgi:hypothetical protein